MLHRSCDSLYSPTYVEVCTNRLYIYLFACTSCLCFYAICVYSPLIIIVGQMSNYFEYTPCVQFLYNWNVWQFFTFSIDMSVSCTCLLTDCCGWFLQRVSIMPITNTVNPALIQPPLIELSALIEPKLGRLGETRNIGWPRCT